MSDNIGISLSGMIDIITEYGIEIRKAGNNIEWKFQGETDEFWRLLMDATELNSQIIEMQRGETSLQWRIVGSDEWIDLITYDNLAYIGSQPIRDEFNHRLDIQGRFIQDNLATPEPIDYMHGNPLLLQDGEYTEIDFLPMSPFMTKDTFSIDSNRLKLWPIQLMHDTSVQRLSINVLTAADATIQLFIYNYDEITNKPTTRVFSSNILDCSTTGIKSSSSAFFLDRGYYFIGYQKIGIGNPIVRSITDKSFHIISGFSTLESAADTSAASTIKSCYSFELATDNISENEYEISSSHRIIFALLRSQSESEIIADEVGSFDSPSTLVDVVYCHYDDYYYFLTNNSIRKSRDFITFEDIPFEASLHLTAFEKIRELPNGNIIVIERSYIWLKQPSSTIFERIMKIEKAKYWDAANVHLISDYNSNNFFIFYNLTSAYFNAYTLNETNNISMTQYQQIFSHKGVVYGCYVPNDNSWILAVTTTTSLYVLKFFGTNTTISLVYSNSLSSLYSEPEIPIIVHHITKNIYLQFPDNYKIYCIISADDGWTFGDEIIMTGSGDESLIFVNLLENNFVYKVYVNNPNIYFNNSKISLSNESFLFNTHMSGNLLAILKPSEDGNEFVAFTSSSHYIKCHIIEKE